MKKWQIISLLATLAVILLAAGTLPGIGKEQPRELSWDDLVPSPGTPPPPPPVFPGAGIPGDEAAPSNPFGFVPLYTFNPVRELDGQYIKLPGYIVPLESDEGGLLDEFLLVPYFGACIHVPPPPPNQLVYVKLKKPFFLKSMEEPYWVTGRMSTKPWLGEFADSDYVLDGESVEIFRWRDN